MRLVSFLKGLFKSEPGAWENSQRLEAMEAAREKLSFLRIADSDVANSARLVALCAGECIDACKKESTFDPLAAACLDEAIDIVGIFLAESNDAAIEKRYALPDKDPFVDAKERTLQALKEKALMLRERRVQIDGGLPPEARMSIREELK